MALVIQKTVPQALVAALTVWDPAEVVAQGV